MKKQILVAILVAALILALTISAIAKPAKDNDNQDFSGTSVVVTAPESVLMEEEAQILINLDNLAKDRGLPQVSIWVNGSQVAYYAEVAKGATVAYVIDVNTAEAGLNDFVIEVWTRLGNKNFQDLLYGDTITVEVIEPDFYVAYMDADTVYLGWTAVKWNDRIPVPADPVKEGYIFIGWKTQWSDELLEVDGLTYAQLVKGNRTMTSESIWAVWEELSDLLPKDYLKDIPLEDILNAVVRQGNVLKLVFPDGKEFILKTGVSNLNVDGEVDLGDGYWIVFNFKGNLNPNNSTFRVEYRGPVFYVWTDDMTVGDALVDTQHKELIKMTNELQVACYYGQPPSKLHKMLIEIANDSVQHFADEEQLMLTVGYPGYTEHKQIHDDFLAVVVAALEQVETQGASADLISEITKTVGNWVIKHILQADVKIYPYI